MSTLTKVFIVVLSISSIMFTVLAADAAVKTTDWKSTAQKFEEHARVADTNLRNMMAASAAELAAARDTISGHLRTIGGLREEVSSKNAEITALRAEKAQRQADESSATAMNRALLAQLDAASQAREEYKKQRDALERQMIDTERRNIDLSDRVNELTAVVSVLQEEKRQYEQQINILQTQLAGGRGGSVTFEDPAGAALRNVDALSPVAAAPIRGQVVEVSDRLIRMSVGSADGVRAGMTFVVHRGDEYIGDVKVDLVNPNECAGRLIRNDRSRQPARGDGVTDAQSLASARG